MSGASAGSATPLASPAAGGATAAVRKAEASGEASPDEDLSKALCYLRCDHDNCRRWRPATNCCSRCKDCCVRVWDRWCEDHLDARQKHCFANDMPIPVVDDTKSLKANGKLDRKLVAEKSFMDFNEVALIWDMQQYWLGGSVKGSDAWELESLARSKAAGRSRRSGGPAQELCKKRPRWAWVKRVSSVHDDQPKRPPTGAAAKASGQNGAAAPAAAVAGGGAATFSLPELQQALGFIRYPPPPNAVTAQPLSVKPLLPIPRALAGDAFDQSVAASCGNNNASATARRGAWGSDRSFQERLAAVRALPRDQRAFPPPTPATLSKIDPSAAGRGELLDLASEEAYYAASRQHRMQWRSQQDSLGPTKGGADVYEVLFRWACQKEEIDPDMLARVAPSDQPLALYESSDPAARAIRAGVSARNEEAGPLAAAALGRLAALATDLAGRTAAQAEAKKAARDALVSRRRAEQLQQERHAAQVLAQAKKKGAKRRRTDRSAAVASAAAEPAAPAAGQWLTDAVKAKKKTKK